MNIPDLESKLVSWIPQRRWFRAKSRRIERVRVADTVPFGEFTFLFLRVEYGDGGDDYVMLVNASGEDVLGGADVSAQLLDAFGGPPLKGKNTTIRFEALPALAARKAEAGATFTAKPVTTEQTNTSVLLGNSFVLKILRQLDEGTSPDMEMGEFLTMTGYAHAPALAGTIIVERAAKSASTLGVLHRFSANEGEAWTYTLDQLDAYLNGKASSAEYARLAELLGKRVAEMHVALASRTDLPDFAPAPLDKNRRADMVMAAKHSLERATAAVQKARGNVEALKTALPSVRERLDRFAALPADPISTRVHGDLHLGQVLFTGDDFIIIDFEGEPARALLERKAKRSPFVDVAGMLRSFHYAAMTGARKNAAHTEKAKAWYAEMRTAFLRGWESAARTSPLLALDPTVLDFALLEKCIYEVNYEADNRPDWIDIPLGALIERS